MSKNKPNVQDEFLMEKLLIKGNVTIFLANGMPIKGTISKFDSFTILLNDGKKDMLIYKHGILTVI